MPDKVIDTLIEGNDEYQWKLMNDEESIKIYGKIPTLPILVLTCMDPRIDVHRIFQLNPGDVFIIRNAGNQFTEDVLRSMLIAIYEYNVRYIIVLGHLDCRIKKINLDDLRRKVSPDLLKYIGQSSVSFRFALQNFFKTFADELINVNNQVGKIKSSKNIPEYIKVMGMLYDPNSGWIFSESDLAEYQFYENLMQDYNELIQKKKMDHINYLETIEKEIVGTDENSLKEHPIKLEKVKIENKTSNSEKIPEETMETTENLFIEAKQLLESNFDEFRLPNLNKVMKTVVKVKTPKIYSPKIKVYVPSINKPKNMEEKD